MKVGSLFSGIGGLDLGLERAGMEVVWQVENDPFCNRVLAKHWPNVTRYEDVRDVDFRQVEPVEVIAGGFPCQDISHAGKRTGMAGSKSSLWYEFERAVCEIRPQFVLVENVAGLLVRGLDGVLGRLADLGYDAEWNVLPAAAVGAPHLRARVFVLAYPGGFGDGLAASTISAGWDESIDCDWWQAEPGVGRVADGVPDQVDRLRALGNAVVPPVAEWIGRRIMAVA